MTSLGSFTTFAVAGAAVLVLRLVAARYKRQKYLPGPPRLPFIGNLLQIPQTEAWVTYMNWKETYGDAMYLEVVGSPLVVLNTYQGCVDLLEKRAHIYSDRPMSIVSNKMMGWENSAVTCHDDDRWKRYRRMTSQSLRKDLVKQFHPIQEKETARFLGALLTEPKKFMEHFRFAAARSLLLNIYGIDVGEAHDPIITVAQQAMAMAVVGAQPGNFMVDFFPFLQYVPDWFPGAGWKKFARKGKELTDEMIETPFNRTLQDMKTGNYPHSFAAMNLEKQEDPHAVKWLSNTLLLAGTDTSVASIHGFILAMVLYPEVQRKAQAELDAVIGPGRLPLVSDRERLPYMNAMMREMIRWQPVSPIALPHRLTKDDVYKGCFIPAGTIVLGNTWAITRDTALYDDPEKFNPDRFLPMFDPSIPHNPEDILLDPLNYGFGYGRRICAGMHYAESMVFVTMARLLATFNLRMATDDKGRNIIPEVKFNSEVVREVYPFPCEITPRSAAAQALVAANANIDI